MSSVHRLMSIPLEERGPAELREMISCAIKLEHATLPPYLCAMWSIMDRKHEAYPILRGIVKEEMGHMGLMCNLLTTIGGTPQLTAKDFIPDYPSPLPCDITPRDPAQSAHVDRGIVSPYASGRFRCLHDYRLSGKRSGCLASGG